MTFKTPTGRLKDIPHINSYRVDWDADQGSDFSTDVLSFLEPYWKHDIVFAELPVAGTRMRYDFVNLTKKVVVETDGEQHDDPAAFHNRGSKAIWLAQIKRDELKNRGAAMNGFKMVRIKPDDLPLTKKWFLDTYDIAL